MNTRRVDPVFASNKFKCYISICNISKNDYQTEDFAVHDDKDAFNGENYVNYEDGAYSVGAGPTSNDRGY